MRKFVAALLFLVVMASLVSMVGFGEIAFAESDCMMSYTGFQELRPNGWEGLEHL